MMADKVVGFLKRFWPGLVIAGAALTAMFSMYRGKPLIWGIDSTWPINLREIPRYFKLLDGGLAAPDVRKLPFLAPLGMVLLVWHFLHLPYSPSLAQHLTIWVLLSCAGLSSFTLIRTFFPSTSRVASCGGAIFYMFNLFAITTIWTPLSNLVFHYCLFPFVLVLWHKAFLNRSPMRALLAASVWTLTLTPAYTTTPAVVTDIAVLGSLFVFHLAHGKGGRGRLIATGSTLLATWLFLNIFWIAPLGSYLNAETARGLAQGNPLDLFRLNSAPFLQAIRLGGYWGLNATYKQSPYVSWGSFFNGWGAWFGYLVPVIAVIALLGVELSSRSFRSGHRCPRCGQVQSTRCRRCSACNEPRAGMVSASERAHLRYFFILLAVALFLVTGALWPFGAFKSWMFSAAPLASFRSVYQRFMVYAVIGYAPIVAVGLHAIGVLISRRRTHVRATQSLPATAGVLILTYVLAVFAVYPIWTPSYTGSSGIIPSRRTTIPQQYLTDADWISTQRGDFNVLVLPSGPGLQMPLSWNNGIDGFTGIEPLTLVLGHPLVYQDSSAPYLGGLIRSAASGGSHVGAAFRLLNARFVILHLDTNRAFLEGRDDFVGTDIEGIQTRFDHRSDLRLVRSSAYLRIYEVTSWLPARLLAVRKDAVAPLVSLSNKDIRPLPYRVLSPGKYSFSRADVQPGEMVVLNSPFDLHWSAQGAAPTRVDPGLTAFANSFRESTVIIQNSVQERFHIALMTLPLSVLVLITSIIVLRSTSRYSATSRGFDIGRRIRGRHRAIA